MARRLLPGGAMLAPSPRALARLAMTLLAALAIGCAPEAPDDEGDDDVDGHEPTGHRDDAVITGTVNDAVAGSCATGSVKGLSLQIIAEGQCLVPDAYAALPAMPNLSLGDNVFAFLEKPARDRLVDALDAAPSRTLHVNSMLRTIAQQYLLHRWSQSGRCGIGLAAKPGTSNHETGLALDIDDSSGWRSTLEARGFAWFGSSDKVHFDYVGAGSTSYKGLDVEAFQRLWNRNNPSDPIAEDGAWGPQTEARMKKAPAQGFPIGATCGAPTAPPPPSAPACAHAICAEGATLDTACDPCAKAICDADAYCCSTRWDDVCVGEVASICKSDC